MTNPQTEARAIALKISAFAYAKDNPFNSGYLFDNAVEIIAAALAAKDAELVKANMLACANAQDAADESERAERAEAQLAEANKAVKVTPLEWREYLSLGYGVKVVAHDCFGNEFWRFDTQLKDIPQSKIDEANEIYASNILSALAHPAPTHNDGSGAVARDVFAERERQKSVEGWTVEHDDTHSNGEMARAAGVYALIAGSGPTTYRNARECYTLNDTFQDVMEHCWPWNKDWFKPTDRRRDLVKAGALILAEIERLDRADAQVKGTGGSGGR